MSSKELLELAGVPIVVRPPGNPSSPAPLIILWHGFEIPNSEAMLAETLSLEGVQAWKAYQCMPLVTSKNFMRLLPHIMSKPIRQSVYQ